ncbi:glycosyltransferase family 4 protein [Pseudoalteromonas sp. TB43-MNA-CIBAN-0091]|uniref:glycosyltransferase family 4 protein n=1 Tax=Pseudoalteromonas sp. TB43-MNA-CIBAN-0091 TaxID=3140416 RepID=UPI0033076552
MKVLMLLRSKIDNDSRVKKEIETITRLGHEVTLLTVNSMAFNKTEHYTQKYESKRRLVPGISSLLAFFSFLFFCFRNFTTHDVIHAHDLNTLMPAVLLKFLKKNKVKIIYDAHEYEIEMNGQQNKLVKFFKFITEYIGIKFTSKIITVSDSIANEYAHLYSIQKPHLVLNCPVYKEQSKQNLFREKLRVREDQTIFLYQGGLSKGRGIEILLNAFSDLDTDRNVLVCMGYGPLEELIKASANKYATIFFHPAVSPDILLNYTSSADYGVSFIEDSCLSYRYCLPNKIFEYMMAGLPVLTSNLVEMKRLVEQEQVGIVAERNTVEGVREAVQQSLELDYEAIQKNVYEARQTYCWEMQEPIIETVYNGLLNQ